MKKLSIIVPAYNVAPYLSMCVDSLLAQELVPEEYEIIIVNDGSTDKSGLIAAKLAATYDQIRLINQQNQGLSGARNTGIQNAQGKYIQFVDSDDFLEPQVVRPLLEKMEKENLDILRFNYQNVNEQYKIVQPCKNPKYNDDYSDDITDGVTFLTERLGFACYVCQFIFKSELIQKEGNQFKKGMYFEDTEWTPRIMVQAKRVTSVDQVVYNYLLRNDSITRSIGEGKRKKVIYDSLLCIDSVNILSKKINTSKMTAWSKRIIALLHISILKYAKNYSPKEISELIKMLREKKHFPLSMHKLPPNQKRNIAIINISPKLFCWLVR